MEFEEGIDKFACDANECKNQASMACQICVKLKLKPIRYCGQTCFKADWTHHKLIHTNAQHDPIIFQKETGIEVKEVSKTTIENEIIVLKRVVFDLQGKLSQVADKIQEISEKTRNQYLPRRVSIEEKHISEKMAIYVQYTTAYGEYTRAIQILEEKRISLISIRDHRVHQIHDTTALAQQDYEAACLQEEELMRKITLAQELMNSPDQSIDSKSISELAIKEGELLVKRNQLHQMQEMANMKRDKRKAKITELEEQCRRGDVQRRQLRDIVAQLRGSIRVFARIRPLLQGDPPIVTIRPDGIGVRIMKPSTTGGAMSVTIDDNAKEEFIVNFDKTFGPLASQQEVYSNVEEFVQSALDGFHVCVFSFGQSQSGRSHGLRGSDDCDGRGIVPRALLQMSQYLSSQETKGWKYAIEVEFTYILTRLSYCV
jgi:hypothetical protein